MAQFEEVIQLALKQFSPEAAKARHIAIARKGLAAYLATRSVKPGVTIETDGRPALSEESVKPFGIITYRFSDMVAIAAYALALAEALSPVQSGRFRRSWFAMVNERQIAVTDIPAGAMVLITNDQPYFRKIHQGSKGFERYVPPGIVEKVRQQVIRRFRNQVDTNIEFITLEGGYILKGRGRRRRKDTRAGEEMTYPTLVLRPKILV